MEDFLTSEITSSATVQSEFGSRDPDDWWYGPSSLGLGENMAVPERPYCAWNEGAEITYEETNNDPDLPNDARIRVFRIYVYDFKGDFSRITRILNKIKYVAKAMEGKTTLDGVCITRVKSLGKSGNFPDDGYDSNTRYLTLQITVSD